MTEKKVTNKIKNLIKISPDIKKNLFIFSRKKIQIALKIYTHCQKSIENKKITFLENTKKLKIYQLKVADHLKFGRYRFTTKINLII